MTNKVSEHALIQRINRKLRHDGEQLRKRRSLHVAQQISWYFWVDLQRNDIVCQHVDLEEFGRQLRVLRPSEQVAC